MPVAILLPTLNEEQSIGTMIDLVNGVSGGKWKIYVVDSGSTDRTTEIASGKGAGLIELKERGKGIAIRKAFGLINEDFLVLMDADMSYDPAEIPAFLEKLKNSDIVAGSRFRGRIEKGSLSAVNRFGNFMLTLLANVLYSKNSSDVCSGMWGFTRKAYKAMEIDAPHFELEANFFVEAAKKGISVSEIPISYRKRAGTSKLGINDGFKIGIYLLRRRFL